MSQKSVREPTCKREQNTYTSNDPVVEADGLHTRSQYLHAQ